MSQEQEPPKAEPEGQQAVPPPDDDRTPPSGLYIPPPPPVAQLPGVPPPVQLVAPPPAPGQPFWIQGTPMGGVQDGHNTALHPRYWEAEQVAAQRGNLAWGFPAFFLGLGAFFMVSLIMTAIVRSTAGPFGISAALLFFVIVLPNVFLGIAPALYSRREGRGLRADFGIAPTWRDVRVGLACGGISLLAGLLIHRAMFLLYGVDQSVLGGVGRNIGPSIWLVLAGLFFIFGAPLTEELLMRGALWGALEHYRLPRYVILALTALIFAFIHQEPVRTIGLFVQGLAMGSARMITGRTGSSIVAHATNNVIPGLAIMGVLG